MNPALRGLIRLIAEVAAEDYLAEISRNNPASPPDGSACPVEPKPPP